MPFVSLQSSEEDSANRRVHDGELCNIVSILSKLNKVAMSSRSDPTRSAVDIAAQTICDYIATGRFVAGQRLPAADLVEQLGVSNTVLREAFAKLQQDGILEAQRFKGAMVRRLKLDELFQIFDVLNALISWGASAAAETVAADPARRTVLERPRARLQTFVPRDQREHMTLVWDSIDAIIELADNPYLTQVVQRAANPLFKEFLVDSITFQPEVLAHTRTLDDVLASVSRGDSKKAVAAFRKFSRLDMAWIRGPVGKETRARAPSAI